MSVPQKFCIFLLIFLLLNISVAFSINSIGESLEYVGGNLQILDFNSPQLDYNDHFCNYFRFYNLEFSGVTHNIGYLNLEDYSIAVQYFKPENPQGTIILVHGYYDHVGILRNLIHFLLGQGYAVVAYDLPGHGFSSGEKAAISDFRIYTSVLTQLNSIVINNTSSPYHIIGHSTGGSIIIDSLLENRLEKNSKTILVSPLIHSDYWVISKIGNWFADIFADELPRKFRENSSDEEYVDFVKNKDLLQYRKIPLVWFKALSNWNKVINKAESVDKKVVVIQGNADTTVDWKYNIQFIENKFSQSQVFMIDDGGHQLLNESCEIKKQVFEVIGDFLRN